MKKVWNGIRHFFEWLIIYAFLQNAYTLVFVDYDFGATGALAELVVSDPSLYLVAAAFLILGLGLALSKIFKRKRPHKHFLFWTYIVLFYVIVLEFLISGVGVELIDNVFLLVGCAYCWLRWKFETEYLNPKDYDYERH